MVAGLVPSHHAIAVADIGDDGLTRWTVDVLSGVSVGPNVELKVFPAADGAVVVYRGVREGRSFTEAVLVDARGQIPGPAFEAGPAACATDDALAWMGHPSAGAANVLGLGWLAVGGRLPPTKLGSVPNERDPALVCGQKTVFALGDGEQDTTLTTSLVPSRAKPILRDRDFADEEREHDTFVVDDTLGLVRVGQSGSISLRDVGAEISPWHGLGARLTAADDVVAVDGDSETTTLIFTRDDDQGCDGPSAPSVHAIRFAKKTLSEASFDLAPSSCGRELGPFWTGSLGDSFVVAWVERASLRAPGDPPIAALVYRTISSGGLGELRRVARPSDEMVDAGCDKNRCYAVALVRPAPIDKQPGPVVVMAYPE